MRILILRHTDQPAVNICNNIAKYSKHTCTVADRDYPNLNGFDVIFYYNINDLVYDNRKKYYEEMKNSNRKIAVGIQSHRVLDFGLMGRVLALDNIVGICTPTDTNMEEIKAALYYKNLVYEVTPFSADQDMFKLTNEVDENSRDKLKVGYVGSYTPNKCFKPVVLPALEELKDEVKPMLYGQVGSRVSHDHMFEEYNKMDCLIVSSLVNEKRPHETGPMPPMEAALCGRTTVATRCGQLSYIFDDGQLLYFDGTSEGLVIALRQLNNDRRLCKKMGNDARKQMLGKSSWQNIIKAQDEFFERVYGES